MGERLRYYTAGSVLTATLLTALTIVDVSWQAALMLVVGFVMGALWFGLIGADLLPATQNMPVKLTKGRQ